MISWKLLIAKSSLNVYSPRLSNLVAVFFKEKMTIYRPLVKASLSSTTPKLNKCSIDIRLWSNKWKIPKIISKRLLLRTQETRLNKLMKSYCYLINSIG